MEVLTYRFCDPARRFAVSVPGFRLTLREVAATAPPAVVGLRARHWRIDQGTVRGRYLFDDSKALEAFVSDPGFDPAFGSIGNNTADLVLEEPSRGSVSSCNIFERPLFIISAPRAGSTLLYELLAQSPGVWTTDGESEGIIEGIPALHPSARAFESHRLTDIDADAETVRTLRAGFVAELRDWRGRRYLDMPGTERPRRVRMIEKTPENSLRVPFICAAFPDARFVFLHRDARQNVSSILEAWHHDGFVNIPALPGWRRGRWHMLLPEGWRDLDDSVLLDVAAFQWGAANHRALEDLAAVPRDRWMSIDYDELVAVPDAVVNSVCDFAGIDVDTRLAAALTRPLPLSGTTIRPPSPIKWRSNPEFQESALHGLTLLRARLRDLGRISAPPPQPKDPATPIRFSCFLDAGRDPPMAASDNLIVSPSFYFQIGATVPLALVRRTRFRERFLADYPLLWVEDPATSVLYPYWVDRTHALLFRQFVAGRPPPALPEPLVARLVDAGILVTAAYLQTRRREGETVVERARPAFKEARYCILPSLIRATHVSALDRYYRERIAYGDWARGDEQVRLRHGQHNETVSRYFHHQLTDFVGRVAGEPVKPSYAYVSAYREGAVLKPHVDRKQCVFTVSVWIDSLRAPEAAAEPWPLWFQTHAGKISLTQQAGDAVLFRGCELPHWRDRPPPGGASTTLIFHYVPRDFADVLD